MEEVKFEQINKDETKMSYRDKEFFIRRDVKLLKDFQSLNSKARRKMKIDMAKEGLTINNFISTKKENGKTIEDHSELNELEKDYIEEATTEIMNDSCMRFFNMSLMELLLDIGLVNDSSASDMFMTQLIKALTGIDDTKIPSKSKEASN